MSGPLHLAVAPVLVPMLVGALMLLFDDRERRLKTVLSIGALLIGMAASVALLMRVHVAASPVEMVYLVGNWPAPVAISLVADRLSAIMLCLTSALALPAFLFASERWERVGPHFHSLFQFLLMGLNGAFLTGDLFNLFVFVEVMLAASYGLVLHGSGTPRVRAGMHYIAVNLLASLVFLIGIALVFGATGTLNMAEIAVRSELLQGFARPALHAGLAMLGLAFLVKAGMWPLGFWLVPAYSVAAGPVAAIFAILSKVGIYALLRLSLLLPGEGGAFGAVIVFVGGAATIAYASVGVLAAQAMQRAAAYFVLMSSGTLLATFGASHPASTAAALFYLVSSTLATSAFFLLVELLERDQDSAASVLAVTLEAYGDGDDDDEETDAEVGRTVPGAVAILGLCFCVIALVLIGLPPLSGFLAKFAILSSVIGPDAAEAGAGGARRALLAVLIVLSGLVALIALARMGIRAFWAPVEPLAVRITVTETAPILILLGLLVGLAVLAGPAMDLMIATATDLHDPSGYVGMMLGAERVPPYAGAAP